MAITYQGASTAGDSNGSGITGVSRPTTTTDDLFILDLYYESGSTTTNGAVALSNGTWVKEAEQQQAGPNPDFTHVRYRSKYAGEGSTFNISWNLNIGSVWRTAVVTAYRGVDTTTPDDATATIQASGSSSTSATAPTLTTVTNAAWILYGEADFDSRTVTVPTGTTPTFTSRSDFSNLCVATGELTTAGATGSKTGTLASASWNTASLIALRPVVVATKAPAFRLNTAPRVWKRTR